MKWWITGVALLLIVLVGVFVVLPIRCAWRYFTEEDEAGASDDF